MSIDINFGLAELESSLAFYEQRVGLQILEQAEHRVTLGAGKRPVITLQEVLGARPQPPNTTGWQDLPLRAAAKARWF